MSENTNETLKERLAKMQEEKAAVKSKAEEKLVDEFTGVDTDNFSKIAEELKQRKAEEENKSKNDDHVKDTIYIQRDIYEAFQALCIKQGDKKKFINEALKDYIIKRYNQLK